MTCGHGWQAKCTLRERILHIKIVISLGQKQVLRTRPVNLFRISWDCSDADRVTIRNSGMFTFLVQVKVTFSLAPTWRNHVLITVTSHELVAENHSVRKTNLLPCKIAEPLIIIRFLINVQVQGQHPHQWAPFQIAGLLHAWQISHQISRYVYHGGW